MSTRARVRDAAIELFGLAGFGVPLRTIAAQAGVTAGRIVQLYGSKGGLQSACDEHVFTVIREAKRESFTGAAGPTMMPSQLAAIEEYVPYVAYVARRVQAGGDDARAFIEHMADDALGYVGEAVAAGTVVPSRDERARVRYLAETSLGHLALRLSLDAPQTPDELAACVRRHIEAIMLPALELYTHGFLTDRRMLDAYLLYVGDPPEQDQAVPA